MADRRRASSAQQQNAPRIDAVVITCEHGGNRIPASFRRLFDGKESVLESHRGYDPGALALARRCAAVLGAPLFYSTISRLLVELNRSIGHPSLFSKVTKLLPSEERKVLLDRYYRPYRDEVERVISEQTRRRRRVLHLSVHTFTPVLDGRVRRADVGLLHDPKRIGETGFCDAWRRCLKLVAPDLRVWLNYPYRGTADGFTTYLRKRFSASRYLGIELEVNQRFPLGGRAEWQRVQRIIAKTLAEATVM
jgi:predicted N-formylglutamate amidohydrolase